MKIKAQITMTLNLDKCLACHTCSIPCKNAWTTQPGQEYIWFNNVETKPGIGYPKRWEDQKLWKGGWKAKNGRPVLLSGGRLGSLAGIFANCSLPELKDYYEPWNYNYKYLADAPAQKNQPAVGPRSAITGDQIKVEWGPNWEDDLAGVNITGREDVNFKNLQAKIYLQFKNVFMFHLPRLCEHCLHPACVASCPSGALYKRDEDGIVLADQTRCRSWRKCMTGCPYKKVYLNWKTHRAEKCIFCYPRIEAGEPTLCAQACPGRIRYIGIMLYDADRVKEAAGTENEKNLYEQQLSVFLNPHDPAIEKQALADGIPYQFIDAAKNSPVYKLVSEWKIALPLHPEFRTLPMVWYVPPLSPMINAGANSAADIDNMRIPVQYLANLLAAGDDKPVRSALAKIMAMRRFIREMRFMETAKNNQTGIKPGGEDDFAVDLQPDKEKIGAEQVQKLAECGLTPETAFAMYRLLAIARFEERFAVPSARREWADNVEKLKGDAGFPEAIS